MIELGGKTATGFEVPQEVIDGLAAGKRPAVTVTLNGYSYPSTVAVRGGRYLVPVSAAVRACSGVSAGDDVEVSWELDSAPRMVTVPEDLANALATEVTAKAGFEALSYSHQRAYTMWVESAKKAETRTLRVERAIVMLAEGRQQP